MSAMVKPPRHGIDGYPLYVSVKSPLHRAPVAQWIERLTSDQ
jgi:hypothetical protein